MSNEGKQYGSQYWLRVAVNSARNLLNSAVGHELGLQPDEKINWVSPLKPKYTEFKDGAFLRELGIDLRKVPLKKFWPNGGPVWDALAKTTRGKIILCEAKAHIPEIDSPNSGASPKSLELIARSLGQTRTFLGGKPLVDWTRTFYQYSNRIAHLYLLRELNGLDAYLVNIYFINEETMNGPSTVGEWQGALTLIKTHMGITQTVLSPFIKEVFIDVDDLKKATE
jgi:hypothetical protein